MTTTDDKVAAVRAQALSVRPEWNFDRADAYARALVERDDALVNLRNVLSAEGDLTLGDLVTQNEQDQNDGIHPWDAYVPANAAELTRATTRQEADAIEAARQASVQRDTQRAALIHTGLTREQALARVPEPTPKAAAPAPAVAAAPTTADDRYDAIIARIDAALAVGKEVA